MPSSSIKIFLSHSNKQKEFVNQVAEYIGKDLAIVDRFAFESGRNLEEEINASINSSNVFVMLISNDALNSDWCQHELIHFRENMLDTDKATFIPFIIDDTDISDERIKPWIKKYLTNKYNNALMLARVIKRNICEKLWLAEPNIHATSRIFLGRDQDISEITSELNRSINVDRRAIIVTGLPHIGRKRLLREVYVTRINKNLHPSYDFCYISLTDSDSIEDFIEQLNELTHTYEKSDLNTKMENIDNCRDLAVELINQIAQYHERICITDNKCIVTSKGNIADWFRDIIEHPDLEKQIMLFIASYCSLSPAERRKNTKLQAHGLKVIEQKYIREIFIAYAKTRNITCNDSDVDYFINNISGFPKQVYNIVDDIADIDIAAAKKDLPKIKALYDDDLHMLLESLSGDEDLKQVLLIMSKFDFISYDFLSQIYSKDNLSNILEKLRFYSVYETFGSYNQYMRISPAFADYIDRQRLKLKKTYNDRIKNISHEYITLTSPDTLDLSQDLFRIKEQIKDPKFITTTNYIIPSCALKVIIELYRRGDNENVIKIAHKVLYDYKRNNYETISFPIRYWMCLAYCKTQNPEVFKELKEFNGYSYHFILGYYYRIAGNYYRAKSEFEKALSYKNIGQNNSRQYYKAEHELVICLMKLGQYSDALQNARNCYEKDQSNPYFIEAYFRCYIRSSHPDRGILKNLIEKMHNTSYSLKNIVTPTMNAEYEFFIEGNVSNAIQNLEDILLKHKGKELNYAANVLKEICKKQNLNDTYKKIIDKCRFTEDNNFVCEYE